MPALSSKCLSPWSTGEGSLERASRRRAATLAATVMAAALMLSALPAVAAPNPEDPPRGKRMFPWPVAVGTLSHTTVGNEFFNAGTNPRFTDVSFATMEYYVDADTGITDDGRLAVRVKTAAQLNGLPDPPPATFRVSTTLTMANDDGDTATTTIRISTSYTRNPIPQPTFRTGGGAVTAVPGVLVSTFIEGWFDNQGTNPRFSSATFSTLDYYDETYSGIGAHHDGYLFAQAKTSAELNALDTPPPDPFYVYATVTMTNDEGQTATGTITFETDYERDSQ